MSDLPAAPRLAALTLDLGRHGVPGLAAPAAETAHTGPRALSAREGAIARLLFARRAPVALRQPDMQARAVLLPAAAATGRDGPWLSLSVAGQPAALQLGWGMARRAAGLPLEAAAPEDAALLLEDALTGWLDAAEDALGLDLRLTRLDRRAPQLPGLRLALGLEAQAARGGGFRQILPLTLSAGAAEALVPALGRWLRARERLDGLWLRVAVEIEALRLPMASLAGLRAGDALVLGEADPRAMVVVEDQLAAPAEAAGPHGWRLLRGLGPQGPWRAAPRATGMEDVMQDSDAGQGPQTPDPAAGLAAGEATAEAAAPPEATRPQDGDPPGPATGPAEPPPAAPGPGPAPGRDRPAAPQAAPVPFDRVEVRVSIRLGETLMSVAELREAGPGTVLALDRAEGAPVDIVVNGQPIGTGDIVSVAGQRAVEIRTLFGDG